MSKVQTVEFPPVEEQIEFLTRQAAQIRMSNFQNDVAVELYSLKIEKAIKDGNKDLVRTYEAELEEIVKTNEGNNAYLVLLGDRLAKLK